MTLTNHGQSYICFLVQRARGQSADGLTPSPLCVEEFDLSDKNFRPCPCGYQVSGGAAFLVTSPTAQRKYGDPHRDHYTNYLDPLRYASSATTTSRTT